MTNTAAYARRRAWLVLFALALVVAGCVRTPPPPVDDVVRTRQELIATAALDGARVTLGYDPEVVRLLSVTAQSPTTLVRSFDDEDGTVIVGFVSETSLAGVVLTVRWQALESAPAPALLGTQAYDDQRDTTLDGLSLSEPTVEEVLALGRHSAVASATAAATASAGNSANGPAAATAGASAAAGSSSSLSTSSLTAELDASFADYPLGDVDQSGQVDVRDALLALDVVTGADAAPTPYVRYHADLLGDDAASQTDVELLLAKAVDPTLPARLVVRPRLLTYLDLVQGTPVLVGNAGNQPLTDLTFDATGLDGQSVQPIAAQSARFTPTSAPNDAFGAVVVSASGQDPQVVAVGNIVILLAGQSNVTAFTEGVPSDLHDGSAWPSVRMLGNDYVWRAATEPLDDPTGQVDMVSYDASTRTSAGVQAGRLLTAGDDADGVPGTGRYVYLIPAGKGGTSLVANSNDPNGWAASGGLNSVDRTYLLGSATYRALVSAGEQPNPEASNAYAAEGGPVTAVYWYQGESDSRTSDLRSFFAWRTDQVFDSLEGMLATGRGAPVVLYAQLAAHGRDPSDDGVPGRSLAKNLKQLDLAERQRRMETGAFTSAAAALDPATSIAPRPNSYMVVTHDLPRHDDIHLSTAGQRVLAERVALAYLEHGLGLDVDGTGPRLQSVSRSGSVITITTDHVLDDTSDPGPNGYSRYFAAWNGAPSPGDIDFECDPDDVNTTCYGEDNDLVITDVRRDPNDPTAVRITLASNPAGPVYLRYMRPYLSETSAPYLQDVVRASDGGLPLPSFGPLAVD